ncbi:MAG: YraN family protein [Phycisphaerales bacterium]
MPNPSPLQRLTTFLDTLRLKRQRRTSTGARGEQAAADFLKQNNYKIIARNLRNRFGEVDLVALTPDSRTVAIIEVKTAERADAMPELRVNKTKQHKLTALAAQIARRYRLENKPIRFDVIAVNLPPDADPIVRHYPAAFESRV